MPSGFSFLYAEAAAATTATSAAFLAELEAEESAAAKKKASARSKKARKMANKRKVAEENMREVEEERTPFEQWAQSEAAHAMEERKRTRNLEEAAAIMLAAASPSPPPFKRGKTADEIGEKIGALSMPPPDPPPPDPDSVQSILQRVEREAAAEIDARIAALPDEPSRTLKSLLGELFQEVFDEARPAGEKLSASIIKVEEELGDEVWSRGQMVGDGSLLERVRMLREIVGLE
jgi:hypothetical protein